MVNPERIKYVEFSAITASVLGTAPAQYLESPINGEVEKIQLKLGNFASTGSIQVFVSGTNEVVGTFLGNVSGTTGYTTLYPRVYGVSTAGVTGSPQMFDNISVGPWEGILGLWGSGLGSATGVVYTTSRLGVYYK